VLSLKLGITVSEEVAFISDRSAAAEEERVEVS
jgi:hypothetical protein